MNAPYLRNLHLKILSEAMRHSDDVVNLSPCDGFINMNVSNKYNVALMPFIDSMEVISEKEADKLFGIYISSKLGIMHLTKNAKGWKYDNEHLRPIVEKIRKCKSIRSSINWRGPGVPDKPFTSVQGDYGYAKGWHYKLNEIFEGKKVNSKVIFNTQEEVDNFIKTTTETWPYKLMYIIDDNAAVIAHLPYLGDYSTPWTDHQLYEYFNLTEEEIKEIESNV